MNTREKDKRVFGEIDTLATRISWSTGVSNMLYWLVWNTKHILGVSKTQYGKQLIEWSHDECIRNAELVDKQAYVAKKLKKELEDSEKPNRYEKPASSMASPREASRRAEYFLEDYLNREFDIFWSLVSDEYLDHYYGQFTCLNGGGNWYTHGYGGLFYASTEISKMHMDNLAYNPDEGLLIANELKLGGKKNPDQILKYALMFSLLRERGFICEDCRFLLLFIEDSRQNYNWEDLIEAEISYCEGSTKDATKALASVKLPRNAEYAATTWHDLIKFNGQYMSSLDLPTQQVEHKLLWGFNKTASAKAVIRKEIGAFPSTGKSHGFLSKRALHCTPVWPASCRQANGPMTRMQRLTRLFAIDIQTCPKCGDWWRATA